MEVDLLHRAVVGVALGLGQKPEHRQRVLAHRLGQGQRADLRLDLGHAGVVMMVVPFPAVGVVMDVLLLVGVLVNVGVFRRMVLARQRLTTMGVIMLVFLFVLVAMCMAMFLRVGVLMGMLVLPIGMALPAVHVQAFLFLAVHRHLHMGAPDAALGGLFRPHLHAGQAQAVHGAQKLRPPGLVQQLPQSRGEHIPRRAHIAFQIQGLHPFTSM